MPAAISFYSVVLWLHISAVVLAFGVTFAYPVIGAVAKAHSVGDLAAYHRFQVTLTRRWITPLMGVVLLAGLYLALDGPYDFGEPWVGATFLLLIVLFGMVGAVFAPTERKMAEWAERDSATGKLGADYLAAERKMNIAGPLAGLLILLSIFLMTTKPG